MATIARTHDSITLAQAADLIRKVGDKVTVTIQSHMGIGKSSLLKTLAEQMPTHYPVYLEAQLMDLGDLQMPKFKNIDGTDVVSFVPNEALGCHRNQPILLMIDEVGKASKSVMNALLRVMLERMIGTYALPEGSRVFATTNLGLEGVGDILPAHARNRMCVVKVRKPTAMEWIENFAIPNKLHPVAIGTVMEYPQMFESFETVEDPNSNPYIFHPKQQRAAFVTPRSMHKAADIMEATEGMTDDVRIHALMGVVGEAAAMDMMTLSRLNDDLPAWERVIGQPDSCPVPKSGVSCCMLVAKAAMRVERESFDAWLSYATRLPKEAQALFARTIMRSDKKNLAATHKTFVDWARTHMYLFS